MICRHQLPPAKPLRLVYSLGLVALCLMIVNVIMSARVAQDGLALDTLVRREADLKIQISQLEQQLLTSTSLQDLSVKAEALGYQPPTSLITINASSRIAHH